MTCLARMVEKHDLDRIIEDIELAGVKLQYIAANVDCEEANASSGRRARLKCMLLRAGASALEVLSRFSAMSASAKVMKKKDWPQPRRRRET